MPELAEEVGKVYKDARNHCQSEFMQLLISFDTYLRCIERELRGSNFSTLTPFRGFAVFVEVPPSKIPPPGPFEAYSNPGYTCSEGHVFMVPTKLEDVLPQLDSLQGAKIWLVANAPVSIR